VKRLSATLLLAALAACNDSPDLDSTALRLEAELTMPDGYVLADFGRHYALLEGDDANAYLGLGDLIPSDDRVVIGLYLYGDEPSRHVYSDWTEMPQVNHPCLVIVPVGTKGEFLTRPELGCARAP